MSLLCSGPPPVHQVLVIDPVPVLRVLGLGAVVADRAEQKRQSGQPLLSVDDQELHHPCGPVGRAGREHQRPDEMREVRASRAVLGECEDVLPQPLQLRLLPRIRPLVERHLVLLRALQEFLKSRLPCRYHLLLTLRSRFLIAYVAC